MNKAVIISIGDELVIGQTINTNASYIAKKLDYLGFSVSEIKTIPDKKNALEKAFTEAKSSNLILITGGLGPTKDDITKAFACDWFGSTLVLHKESLQMLKKYFERKKTRLHEYQKEQCYLPNNATIIPNKYGTASGMWFVKDNRVYIFMPGVPYEMEAMLEDDIIHRLQSHFTFEHKIIHKYLLTANIGESNLAQQIEDIEDNLPPYIKLAYLPDFNQVKLRLSGLHKNLIHLENEIQNFYLQIQNRISPYIIAYEDTDIYDVVAQKLTERKQSMSIAESCTGGFISQSFTSKSGASYFFVGSCICYSNDIKNKILGVSQKKLDTYGAVSEEVVSDLLEGLLNKYKSDYAIAVSGIAGPDGGTKEKPVGTIFIGVASKKGEKIIERKNFWGTRSTNIQRSSLYAIILLNKILC